jgi:hypothetical protein
VQPDGYVYAALQQGLQPVFARAVGIHPDDPGFDVIGDSYLKSTPQGLTLELVSSNMYLLINMWRDGGLEAMSGTESSG